MKSITILTVSAMMTLGLTGCGGGAAKPDASPSTAPAADVKIQFMHTQVAPERVQAIQKILDDFHAANQNITVEEVPVAQDQLATKISALGGSGKLPEVMELNQDFAKIMEKNDFLDYGAIKTVIDSVGKTNFYDGALEAMKTQDGQNYKAAPLAGWVQGIWYSKKAFQEKGLKAPSSWDDILAAAKAFNDPANKKYGIAIPTAKTLFTEQVFSQFALSNGANVFDANGKANFNTPDMKAALEAYKEISKYTMPGSVDVPQVKDAFMSGAAPMALYSTYILSPAYSAGNSADIGFVLPSKKDQAAYGSITGFGIGSDLDAAKKDAAIKFVEFMEKDENNVRWLLMSPGGIQPVLKSVSTNQQFMNNEIIKAYAPIAQDISGAFGKLKLFGSVGGKNFMNMGDVTGKNIISSCVYDVVVQNADVDAALKKAQSDIEAIK